MCHTWCTPENQDPLSLAQASAAEVVGKLVGIIRQFRPQVMATFDETGGYGHPDHIAIYRHTTSAFMQQQMLRNITNTDQHIWSRSFTILPFREVLCGKLVNG